jgi:integrase
LFRGFSIEYRVTFLGLDESFLRVDGWRSGFESVDKLLKHYGRKVRSEHTRLNVVGIVARLCRFVGVENPDDLVKLDHKEVSQIVQNFVDSLRERDLSIRYVNVSLAYLKTFFRVNGFKSEKELEVERYYQPSRYMKREEYIPTPEEIYRMAYAAGSSRNKALILALYTSGLRNSTLRALRYRDVKEELEVGLQIVKVRVYPEMKEIDPNACKGNIPYYSFISKETVEVLTEYRTERREIYGDINDNEPLFSAESTNVDLNVRRNLPVMKKSLAAIVKRAAKKAGIKNWSAVHPHCLRKTFESALRNGGLDVKDQEFLMGHILPGSQDPYYDKTKIDGLRTKYSQIVFFPNRSMDVDKATIESLLAFAKLQGLPEEKINSIREALKKFEHPTADKVIEMLSGSANLSVEFAIRRPEDEKSTVQKLSNNGKPYQSKIIGEKELVSCTEDGWEIVKELSNRKFLIKKPNHVSTS